jgi:hypothetical protein
VESNQIVGNLNFSKNSLAKRSYKCEVKLRVKVSQILIFDAKLRLAPVASLRPAIFREIKVPNYLVIFPASVNNKLEGSKIS